MTWNIFSTPSAEKLAREELNNAQRELLASQSSLEYARAMTDFNMQRVARLEAEVKRYDELREKVPA